MLNPSLKWLETQTERKRNRDTRHHAYMAPPNKKDILASVVILLFSTIFRLLWFQLTYFKMEVELRFRCMGKLPVPLLVFKARVDRCLPR